MRRRQVGECVRSQSFSAASIFVCHPSPAARNAWTTSADNRIVVAILSGFFCRPRLASLACKPAGNAENGRIAVKSAALSSRTSPYASVKGLRLVMSYCLSGVGHAKWRAQATSTSSGTPSTPASFLRVAVVPARLPPSIWLT